MLRKVIIAIIVIFIQQQTVLSHEKCGHSQIPALKDLGYETKIQQVTYTQSASLKRRLINFDYNLRYDKTKVEPMRIYLDYHILRHQEHSRFFRTRSQSDKIIQTVQQIMSPVINYIQDHFSVKQGTNVGSIPLNYDWLTSLFRGNRGFFAISNWRYKSWAQSNTIAEVPCDLIIHVLNDNSAPCGGDSGLLAYAGAIDRDQFGRPIRGYVNFCDTEIQEAVQNHYIETINTLVHELTHVLLMTPDNFQYFNLNKKKHSPDSEIIHYGDNGHIFLTTPKAKEIAQEHYGCYNDSILPGIPLENQGGELTRISHLDERFTVTSVMSGFSYHDLQYFSQFVYAIAEDSGWYTVRIADAMPFRLGYQRGCDFFTKPCIDDVTDTTNWPEFFCDGGAQNRQGCTSDGMSVATCIIEDEKQALFTEFGRIREADGDKMTWIGGSVLNNFCPFYDAEGKGSPKLCMVENDNFHSRCIESKNTETGLQSGECFNIECADWNPTSNEWNKLIINISDKESVECGKNTGRIAVGDIEIICPSIDLYCIGQMPFECEFGTWDTEKQCCICMPGFYGTQCNAKDDCIVTDDEESLDKAAGQASCKEINRERLCGLHHGAQHWHQSDVAYSPPGQGTGSGYGMMGYFIPLAILIILIVVSRLF